MSRLNRTWLALFATAMLAIVGWPGSPIQAAAPKDEVVIGISQEPDTLVPGLGGSLAVSGEIQQALWMGGVRWSDQWKLTPMQAKEVPTLENGLWKLLPNGKMQLTWHLRPLKWHDGVSVDAQDFVFTHRAIMNDKVPVISRDFEKRIENVYAPAADTLIVTYNPMGPFPLAGAPGLGVGGEDLERGWWNGPVPGAVSQYTGSRLEGGYGWQRHCCRSAT